MNGQKDKIALGAAQFGLDYGISNRLGITEHEEVNKILSVARGSGINTIDTAFSYGSSEMVLGQSSTLPDRVVTKFPAPDVRKDLEWYLTQSLERLRQSTLYGYLAHDATVLMNRPEIWTELHAFKESKVVRKVGYSLYDPEQLEILLERQFFPDLIQLPYNILDRRFEAYLPQLKTLGAEIHTRSAFLQGLFFVEENILDSHFAPLKGFLKRFHERYSSFLDKVAVLLKFCLTNPYIDRVVVGVNNHQQLVQNVKSLTRSAVLDIDIPLFPREILLPTYWPNAHGHHRPGK